MKIPGPDHPITLSAEGLRMRARTLGYVIADSTQAVTLQEASYPAVIYFPRDDVEMGFLAKTERTSNCPYKGDASYFSIFLDGQLFENVAWSYEQPYPAMERIEGMIAFYSDRIEVYAVTEEG